MGCGACFRLATPVSTIEPLNILRGRWGLGNQSGGCEGCGRAVVRQRAARGAHSLLPDSVDGVIQVRGSKQSGSKREGRGGTGRLGLSEAGPLPVPIDGRACSFPTPVSRLAPSLCSPFIAWPRGCPPPPPDPLSPLPMPRDAPLRASRGQTEVRYSNRFSASPLILQSSKLQVGKTEGILSHMPTSNNSSTLNTLTTSVHIQSCCSLISSMDPPTHRDVV